MHGLNQYNENKNMLKRYVDLLQLEWVQRDNIIKLTHEISRLGTQNKVIKASYYQKEYPTKIVQFQSKINNENKDQNKETAARPNHKWFERS